MAGPIVSLALGYNSSIACAKTWAEECQKAFLPSSLFHVYKTNEPFVVNGVTVSTVVSLKLAEITFRANPSLMLLATSIGVTFIGNSFTLPSGNVICIIKIN